MAVTVLPKPNEEYICAPKLNVTTAAEIAQRVLKLLSGMGLSINGKHVYCGDYIYSGHTMTLIMGYFVIRECEFLNWQFPCLFHIQVFNFSKCYNLFLKKVRPRPLFRLFSSFQTNITIFTKNKCEKCPFSIRCWDSNPQPLELESPPIDLANWAYQKIFSLVN